MNNALTVILFSLLPQLLCSQPRTLLNLDEGWQYFENNTPSVVRYSENTTPEKIDLPHTWNQWDAVDPNPGYRRDASWYVKKLDLNIDPAKRYVLHFEGANITAEVYLNRQLAGRHVGGYVGFEIELTDFLKTTGENEIAVRVDNGYNPDVIPSQKADFFIYGGITRDVWLKILPKEFIQNVYVKTKNISRQQAETELGVKLNNITFNGLELEVRLFSPAGEQVLESKPANCNSENMVVRLPTLANPMLWSTHSPHLYEVKVFLKKNGKTVDVLSEKFGYRWFDFEPHGAFFLNGEKLKLRGTHRHEEHAGYGAAMPNELHRRDLEMIKEMGANFVRLAHYPQDPEVYRACNELGLIVWDELPWCRGGIGGATWQANTERLLEEQIRQNFNHPSICFWSLGNEVSWLPDFPDGDGREQINTFLRQLNQKAHELDPGRFTAIRKYYDGADLVDVFSPSIWSGWYAGVYKNYGPTLEENRKKYPRFLHMEYGGSSHAGRHTEQPIDDLSGLDDSNWAEVANQSQIESIANSGDWSENYVVDLFDWYLHISETTDWFAGNAQWAFKDFGTPLRPENAIPYLNQKGLADRNGKPKDAYYVFKSYWSEEPMVYIESHSWTERSGAPGEVKTVDVYSNCETVELFHNGRPLGEKKRNPQEFPACGLRWQVLFAEGENQLRAVGKTAAGKVVSDSLAITWHTEPFGKPNEITLHTEPLPNGNLLVVATMRDDRGRRVLDYEKRVYFSHDGAGKLMENYGTPNGSSIIEFANGRAAIEFVPGEGRAVIEARNQDFKGTYLQISGQ
ncbi:MAG: glycoside hydrolase family 2 protein [Lewinellaceae bacterium]|nr:glycoside hydrolase family 2 protein [Lewinellaceae bacterium]